MEQEPKKEAPQQLPSLEEMEQAGASMENRNESMISMNLTRSELELLGAGLVDLAIKGRYSTGEVVDQVAAKSLLQKIDKIENSY